MKLPSRRASGFTLVEIMIVVGIVGLLSAIAVPALVHFKHTTEDVLVKNTLRQLYDAKELYFTDEGAGKIGTNLAGLAKAGYLSHSTEAATQHDVGNWHTTALSSISYQPGKPIKLTEWSRSGNRKTYGRTMVYPESD